MEVKKSYDWLGFDPPKNYKGSVLTIGDPLGMEESKGHIDKLRISRGIARWTVNFTPTKDITVLYYIVKILKWIGMTYVWGCAVGITGFILLSLYHYYIGG